jgi:tRNA threonylcarbamoyladenosine biosynthesis protein TsaB
MSLLLGVETSGEVTGLALVRDGRAIARANEPAATRHNENLFRLLDRLFAECGRRPDQLAGIGVSLGPGMFTSLRVGLAAAKAIVLTGRTRLCGIDTRDAIAATVMRLSEYSESVPLLVMIDARKGEVHASLYQGAKRIDDLGILTPPDLAAVARSRLLVAGSGIRPCQPQLEAVLGSGAFFSDVAYPDPLVIAELAGLRLARGLEDDPDRITPFYLRRTDAELRRCAPQKRTADEPR